MITAARGRYEDQVWHLEDGIRKKLDDEGFTVEDSGFAPWTFLWSKVRGLFGKPKDDR